MTDRNSLRRASEPEPEHTDAVILELCAPRYADMRREMMNRSEVEALTGKRKRNGGFRKFVNLVDATRRKKGLSSAIATFVLGGVSLMQTALSGFEPGLEFVSVSFLLLYLFHCMMMYSKYYITLIFDPV